MSQGFVHCQLNVDLKASVTVGDKLKMTCDGNMGGIVDANAQIQFANEDDQYKLVILKVDSATDKSAQFTVTSYRTGQHKDMVLNITDGVARLQTDPLSWTVTSVMKQPKAVPSMGPFEISYPLWFWIALGVGIWLVLGSILVFYLIRQRRKKLMEELEKYSTMLPPFGQFSKDARFNLRSVSHIRAEEEARSALRKIDEDFRLYLIRELKVPALQYGTRDILKELKKYHRIIYDENSTDLRRVLFELVKARKHNENVQAKECEELLHLTRTMADKIYAVKRRART